MKTINALIILVALILVGCANDNYIIIPSTSNATNGTVGPQGPPGPQGPAGNNGTDGANGTSISFTSIYNFGNGSYQWNFSDGTSYITGNLTGTKGNTGSSGSDGTDGTNGTNGVSITNATVLANGSLNVTLSNGTSFISGNLTGPVGATGPQGPAGNNGTDGANGTNGINGSNASVTGQHPYINVTDGVVDANTTAFDIRYTLASNFLSYQGLIYTNVTNLQTTKFDSTGAGLEGSGTTVSIEVAYQLPQGCADGFIPTWNASFGWWNCSADINQYTNVTALQTFRDAIYVNTTNLQNSNTTTNTRINDINTSKVPYSGATGNVTLGSYSLLAHSVKPDGSDGLLIEAANSMDVASFGVGNTNNSLFYGSVSLFNGQNLCLGGVCRSTWPNETLLYQNVTDLQNSNTSTNLRVTTINATVQNLLTSNTSTNTRVDTLNTTINAQYTNITALQTGKGVANLSFTTISTTSGSAPVADAALDTLTLTAGSGITITGDSTTDTITFSASAGGGNVSGGSGNGTLGYLAMWNATNTITNTSLFVATNGNLYLPRNILLADYGSDGSLLFNNGAAGGVYWVRASDRIRYACNAAGTGTCELYGGSLYFAGSADPTLSLYSDSVDRTLSVVNTGAMGANFVVDNNVTIGEILTAKQICLNGACSTNGTLFNATTVDYVDRTGAATFNGTILLSLSLNANSAYTIECDIMQQTAAATTGVQYKFNTTGTPDYVRYSATYYTSTTAEALCSGNSVSSNTCAATAGSTTASPYRYRAYIDTSATATRWSLEMATEIDLSAATMYRGSFCRATKVI